MKKGKTSKIVAVTVSALLILLAIAVTIVNFNSAIQGLKITWILGVRSSLSEEELAKVKANGEALAEEIESEGIIMTKNEGKTLPLSYTDTKEKGGVNVFGWSSTSWVPGGSGSGRVTQKDGNFYAETGIVNALVKAGINYNTELYKFYMDYIPALNGNGNGATENTKISLPNGSYMSGNNRPGWKASNGGTLNAYDFHYSRIIEPAMNNYSEALKTSAEAFSDTAIVVISRVSGESNDSPRVQYKGNADLSNITTSSVIGDATRHYLEISTEEEELLRYVGKNYDKTVVLINSTNTMELGFMNTIEGLDACLIVGCTGINAATAIPKVLFDQVPVDGNGKLSPSGTLTDGITPSGKTIATYAYDLKTAASWANAGDSNQSSAATTSGTGLSAANAPAEYGQNYYTGVTKNMDLYPWGVGGDSAPSNGNYNTGYRSEGYQGITYMDYSEGIYVGYKWYETADTMKYWDNAGADWNKSSYTKKPLNATGYNAVVQYPFGYGQSYTTFAWELIAAEPANGANLAKSDKIKLSVKVTNTGSLPGKEVVQAYFDPHYNPGGVEKSSVNLAAFGKTRVLEPGDDQTLVLEFDTFDMASYDCYNRSGLVGAKGSYVLEAGDYKITLRTDAHNIATVGMLGATITYRVPAGGIVYGTDPATGEAVNNKFTGDVVKQADYDKVQLDGSEESVPVKYMARNNFGGTFPKLQPARAITEAVKAQNLYTKAMADDWAARNEANTPTQIGSGSLKVWDSNKTVKTCDAAAGTDEEEAWYETTDPITRTKLTDLGYALAKDFKDDRWDSILNQISLTQLTSKDKGVGITIMPGTLGEAEISTIGKPVTVSLDGPNQWASFTGDYGKGTGFPNSNVTAQTFNKRLAYHMGLQFGKDAKTVGGNGWLGPGINIHRSPLGGRNYEYYSEDSYLTGVMCAEAVKGAKNTGVYVYLKHLALYDQESNRDALHVWVTEQALREIYLKPFRIAILRYAETGHGATGIMTAYGRIGAVWTGGSYALITGVVREEWQFNGAVLTDWSDHIYFMNMSHALRAGGDIGINCGWDSRIDSSSTFSTGAFQHAARRAAKHIVWTWLNAEYTAANYNPTADGETIYSGEAIPNFDWITLLVFIYWGIAVATGGVLVYFAFIKKPKQT